MMQTGPPGHKAPVSGKQDGRDRLESQLEMLFSDAILPEMARTVERRPPPAVTTRRLTAADAIVSPNAIGIPVAPGRTSWLPAPNWVFATLATLAIFVVLAYAIVDPKSRALRIFRLAPRSEATTASQTDKLAAATAPTAQVPARTAAVATAKVLPEARALVQDTQTPASTSTVSAGLTTEAEPSPNPTSTRIVLPLPTSTPIPSVTATAVVRADPIATSVLTATLDTLPAWPTDTPAPSPTITSSPTIAVSPTAEATVAAPPTPHTSPSNPTRLKIPAIDLEAPIITVGFQTIVIGGQNASTWAVPSYYAAGWHHTSAPPGMIGNTVLNGHQYIHGGVFSKLAALQTNDEIIVFAGDIAHRFRVTERHLLEEEGQPLSVRMQNARWIMPTPDERLTLVTCAPDTQSTHRLIVVARPIE